MFQVMEAWCFLGVFLVFRHSCCQNHIRKRHASTIATMNLFGCKLMELFPGLKLHVLQEMDVLAYKQIGVCSFEFVHHHISWLVDFKTIQ